MPKFSKRSLDNQQGLHPDLIRVLNRAIGYFDFMVICGVRTSDEQRELYTHGRTTAQVRAQGINLPGKPNLPKVTWTLNSRHKINPTTGYGHAFDAVPFPVDWNDTKRFDLMAAAIFRAAREEGVSIRWGADWDGDGKPRERGESDSPHFELA